MTPAAHGPPADSPAPAGARRAPSPVDAPSLWHSLAVQGRVIRALLLRELITRFGRHNLGMLWLFLEPALFTAGVAALWALSGLKNTSSIPIVAFAVTGYSSVLMWRNTASLCLHAIEQNLNLLYHRNVRVHDVFAARILLESAGATTSFAVLAAVCSAVGWMPPPEDLLQVLAGWFLLAWFGAALAILLGATVAFSELVVRVWTPVSYLLFPLSGAAFMVEWLPPAGREAVLWLPMVHAVEIIRGGYFGRLVPAHYDLAYLMIVNLLLLGAGLVALRAAALRVENR